jgi:hypothetical protein
MDIDTGGDITDGGGIPTEGVTTGGITTGGRATTLEARLFFHGTRTATMRLHR